MERRTGHVTPTLDISVDVVKVIITAEKVLMRPALILIVRTCVSGMRLGGLMLSDYPPYKLLLCEVSILGSLLTINK